MDSTVKTTFESYPNVARCQLLKIRAAIIEVAEEEALGAVVESLKWGEPSYNTNNGSPVRLGWKNKSPETVSVYFNCKTLLIETFKEVYQDTFQYVGKREIVFDADGHIPLQALKGCLSMALRYHSIKHMPLLGA